MENPSSDFPREWWREFMMDCPDGMLTREKVLEMLLYILPRSERPKSFHVLKYFLFRENGQIVADLIFTAFDKVMENTLPWSPYL